MLHDAHICALGEGALWHPTRKQVFWFDIMNRQLRSAGRHWDFDTYVSAAGWVDQTSLLVASATDLRRVDIDTGDSVSLVPLEADQPDLRSNDGRADPWGGFWIGTMALAKTPGAGTIYRYYRGDLTPLFPGLTIPNAICFAPDRSRAYFTDTPTQIIMTVALDDDGWPAGDPVPFIDLSETDLFPDGAVTDADGNLWSAQWGASRVACYSPGGDFLRAVPVPASQTSCPAFGGDDLTTLFVTSATEDIPARAPDGQTFAIPGAGRGRPEPRVLL